MHPVANFVVAKAFERAHPEQLSYALQELRESLSRLRQTRIGVLRALIERAAALSVLEDEICEAICSAFQIRTQEDRKAFVPYALALKSPSVGNSHHVLSVTDTCYRNMLRPLEKRVLRQRVPSHPRNREAMQHPTLLSPLRLARCSYNLFCGFIRRLMRSYLIAWSHYHRKNYSHSRTTQLRRVSLMPSSTAQPSRPDHGVHYSGP